MNTIICLFAIFAITYFIKEMDGPFGIMTAIRGYLLRSAIFGVFFYNLLSCYFCTGTYSGILVYLVDSRFHNIDLCGVMLWGFGGAGISMLGGSIINNLWVKND